MWNVSSCFRFDGTILERGRWINQAHDFLIIFWWIVCKRKIWAGWSTTAIFLSNFYYYLYDGASYPNSTLLFILYLCPNIFFCGFWIFFSHTNNTYAEIKIYVHSFYQYGYILLILIHRYIRIGYSLQVVGRSSIRGNINNPPLQAAVHQYYE